MSNSCTSRRPHHGLQTFATSWQHLNFHLRHLNYHLRHPGPTRRKSEVMPNITCIPDTEINSVLQFCHSAPGGGHYGSSRTAKKVLDCGLYWPSIFKDAHQLVSTCERCQKQGWP
ncbi:hypothetical protein CR513_08705, partial [Mucuna pruriens]